MCETKIVLLSLAIILLLAVNFCRYQAHTEKKWDATAESKVKVLAKIGTRSPVATVANAFV